MAFLQQARCERSKPIGLEEPLSTRVAENALDILDTKSVLALANCVPNDGTTSGSAYTLVQKLLDLAYELRDTASEDAMAHLCYIRDRLIKDCRKKKPTQQELLKYAYVILILLEEQISVPGKTGDELRRLFDAVHGLLNPENVKLNSKWRTKRGDEGYISEVTARVSSYFNTIPPTRLECPSLGQMAALNPPQRMLQYLISKQGPEDQRMLVVMRPGLGKSIVCLNVFNNYKDRPRILAAASDELLANIKAEDGKIRDSQLIEKYGDDVLNGVVFCDFRYADVVKPGPNDPPGAELPTGFGNRKVQEVLDDPDGVIVIDEAHELYDMDVKTAVNRAGAYFALAQKHAVEFRLLLQRSKCKVVVALTGTPFSDEAPRSPSVKPDDYEEERTTEVTEGEVLDTDELARLFKTASLGKEEAPSADELVDALDKTSITDDTDESTLEKSQKDVDFNDSMDDELSGPSQSIENVQDEKHLMECSLFMPLIDAAAKKALEKAYSNVDDLCSVVSAAIHKTVGIPTERVATLEPGDDFVDKVTKGIQILTGQLEGNPAERSEGMRALGIESERAPEPSFASARRRQDNLEEVVKLTGGLTDRGDALCRMVTRNAPPWKWKGCVLSANYYTGTTAFLAIDPEMRMLPSLFGTTLSRSVNVVQVDLDKIPTPKRVKGAPRAKYQGPDAKYKAKADCRIANIPFLVSSGSTRAAFDDAALKEPDRLIPKLNSAVESIVRARNPLPIVNDIDGPVIFESIEPPIEGVSSQGLVTFRLQVPRENLLFPNVASLEGVRATPRPSIKQGHLSSAILQFPDGTAHIVEYLPRSMLKSSPVQYDRALETDPVAADAIVAIPCHDPSRTVLVRNTKIVVYDAVRCAVDRVMTYEVPEDAVVQELVLHEPTKVDTTPEYFSFEHDTGDEDDEVTVMYFRNDHEGSFKPRQLVMIAADEGFELFEKLLYLKGGADVEAATVPLIVPGDASTDERKRAIGDFIDQFNGTDATKDIAIVEVGKFSTGLDVVGSRPEGNSRPLGCSLIHHVTEPNTAVQYLQRTLRVSRFCQRRAGRICRIVMYQVVGGTSGIAACSERARKQLEGSMQQLFGGGEEVGLLERFDDISLNKDLSELMNASAASAVLAGGTFFRRSYYPTIGHLSGLDMQTLQLVGDFVKHVNAACEKQRKRVSETPCVAHSSKECPWLMCSTRDSSHPCVRRLQGSLCSNLPTAFGNFSSWMQNLNARDVSELLRSEVAKPVWRELTNSGALKFTSSGQHFEFEKLPHPEADKLYSLADQLRKRVSMHGQDGTKRSSISLPVIFACALVAENWLLMMGGRLQTDKNALLVFPEFCASLMVVLYDVGQRLYRSRMPGRASTDDQINRANRFLDRLKFTSNVRYAALTGIIAAASMGAAYGGAHKDNVEAAGDEGKAPPEPMEEEANGASSEEAEDGAAIRTDALPPSPKPVKRRKKRSAAKHNERDPYTLLYIYEKELQTVLDGKSNAFEWASDPAHLFVPLLAVQIYAYRLQTSRIVE